MSSNALNDQIKEDMKLAMKGQNKDRLSVIRLILAAIKQKEVDERIQLDDTQVLAVLDKMAKQRRESINAFEQANRQELADKEAFELSVIQHYLPQPLSDQALQELIETAVAQSEASSIKDMGKVMNALRSQVQGRADMTKVSAKIKEILSAS